MNKIKKAETIYDVHDLIKNRWSPRAYSDTPIPEEILNSLFEAASWSASAQNEQPWRFICGIKGQGENYNKIFQALVEWNQRWAQTAPVLAIGVAKLFYEHKNRPNPYAHYDLGQAVANLSLQATSKGLYLRQMGGFEKDLARKAFDIPDQFEPVVAMAIGYPGNPEILPDDIRENESKARTRLALDQILFTSDFQP